MKSNYLKTAKSAQFGIAKKKSGFLGGGHYRGADAK